MAARVFKIGILLTILFGALAAARAEEYIGKIKAEKILVTTTAGNGQPHTYLETERPEVTAMTVEIPPGAETGWHLHTVPGRQFHHSAQVGTTAAWPGRQQ